MVGVFESTLASLLWRDFDIQFFSVCKRVSYFFIDFLGGIKNLFNIELMSTTRLCRPRFSGYAHLTVNCLLQ